MKLSELFRSCLNARYTKTKYHGNYAIEVKGSVIYIYFEWSKGIMDWVHNFNFPKKPYKRMNDIWYCHRGFLKVWKGMRDQVREEVLDIFGTGKITKIVCVGYSHGGAICLLATEDMRFLMNSLFPHVHVVGVGFGAPRVLWGKIPESVRNRLKSYRVVAIDGDIVTKLPPQLFGFKHLKKVNTINQKYEYNPIEAHFSRNYIKELEKIDKMSADY